MRRSNAPSLALVGPSGPALALPATGRLPARPGAAPALAAAAATACPDGWVPRRLPPPAPLPTLDPACGIGRLPSHGGIGATWQRLRRWLLAF